MLSDCILQKVSEKVGGAEGTKLDDDFKEMERVSLHHLEFSLTSNYPAY